MKKVCYRRLPRWVIWWGSPDITTRAIRTIHRIYPFPSAPSIVWYRVPGILIYEPGPRNWSAYVPDLPGCVATAKAQKALEQRIREAIEFHIEGMRLHGETVPEPAIRAGTVSVAVG